MIKKRVLVLADESNATQAASQIFHRKMDWLRLREHLSVGAHNEARNLVEMVLYVGLPPVIPEWGRKRDAKARFVHWARSNGFLVQEKNGHPVGDNQYKANVDVMMAIDTVDLALHIKPDVVVLVTGDGDFAHLALTIRRQGIRVEVASVPQTLNGELRAAANSIIDLTSLYNSFEPFEPNDGDFDDLELAYDAK
jgi:uncharacterized LabA/DUF88 family protein